MVYQIYAGTYSDGRESLGRFFSGALPLVAALMLVGLLSYSSQFTTGREPNISSPQNLNLSASQIPRGGSGNTSSSAPATPPARSLPAASSGSSEASASLLPGPSASDTSGSTAEGLTSTGGGLGGDSSGNADGSSDLLPATVIIPPTDLQLGDKQILSTDGTTITIN